MVLPGPSAMAMRCLKRAAVASTRLTTQRPSPSSSVTNNLLIAARPLSSIGSSSIHARTSNDASVASLGSSLTQLSIRNDSRRQQQPTAAQRTLSSVAPAKDQPLGEPITFLSLNNLKDNPGARRKKRRVGRGIGSSKGKTCGRGHKGQKARAGGGVHPTFEGGQTKFYKRLPKIGKMKNSKFKLELVSLNVGKVQDYVSMGRLIPERSDGVITMRDFVNAGMFPNSSIKSGVKLLGEGKEHLKDKLLIEVPFASASAIEAIEARGGFVTTVHYNRLALRALLKPHKFHMKPENMLAVEAEERGEGASGEDDGEVDTEGMDIHDLHLLPRRARPPPKYQTYYTNYAKRGYLNPRVQLERKKRGLKDILRTF